MSAPKISWGILGCGDVCERKSGPAFSETVGSELVAVMRRDLQKAEDFAKRHGVPCWHGTIDDLLGNRQLNSIYIASPPSSHKEQAIAALHRGFNVYVEKPVSINAADAREMLEVLRNSPGRLCVAHYRRCLPLFVRVKEILQSNCIGEVRYCQLRTWQCKPTQSAEDNWRLNPAISGGGLFHDLSPHQLDIMLFLFGKPIQCQGISVTQSEQSGPADNVSGMAIFENNIIFNGSWCFCVNELDATDECLIVGSKGSIRFQFFGPSSELTLRYRKDDDGEICSQTHFFEHPAVIQSPMIEAVVQYFQDDAGQSDNPCSLEDAIIVMDMMDAFTTNNQQSCFGRTP
jgi:predicted dehydrogenase